MDLLTLFVIVWTCTIIGLFSYFVLIKPNLKNKLGYIPTPYQRPARSVILDKCKHKYGWGTVLGSTRVSPYRNIFKMNTSIGILNFTYEDHEIEPLDKFDSVSGDGIQAFIVKESWINTTPDTVNNELISLREQLLRERESSGYQNILKTQYQHNTDRELDDRANLLLDFKRSERKADAGVKQQAQ